MALPDLTSVCAVVMYVVVVTCPVVLVWVLLWRVILSSAIVVCRQTWRRCVCACALTACSAATVFTRSERAPSCGSWRSRASSKITRAGQLLSRTGLLMSRAGQLLSRTGQLLSRTRQLLSCTGQLLSRTGQLLLRTGRLLLLFLLS